VGDKAAEVTGRSPTERAPAEGHPRSRQHDQSLYDLALSLVSQSPGLLPAATNFGNSLPAAHAKNDSPPDIVGVAGKEPGTPDSEETYGPLEDYMTPVESEIPQIKVNLVDSSTCPDPSNARIPEGPVPRCLTDVPHWVRYTNA
jgi:hypothetical protein